MKKITVLCLTLFLIFTLTACSGSSLPAGSTSTNLPQTSNTTLSVSDSSTENGTLITLGKNITIEGNGAQANGNVVNITDGGTYTISGELNSGQVDVNTKEKVTLNLNGVNITNPSGPALQITDAKKVTLNLMEGSINTLADGKSNNENDAAIFTNDTLVIEGSGTLIVTGNNQEGISSDDDLIIEGGVIKITALDDGLNAHDDITINGGYLYISAGGDAVDSNGTLNINGGMTIAMGSTAPGDGGVDAEGLFTLTGGTLIATGNADAAPGSDSSQYSVYINAGSNQAAGTIFHIEQDGQEIMTFAPARSYQTIFFSSPDLVNDGVYQVNFGGSANNADEFGFFDSDSYTAVGESSNVSVTAAITPAGVGGMGVGGGMGGPGGGMGGRGGPGGGMMPPDGAEPPQFDNN